MVTTHLLPGAQLLELLESLGRQLSVLEPQGQVGGIGRLLLKTAEQCIEVYVDYSDVVFKFECFGLTWKPATSAGQLECSKVSRVDQPKSILLLCRFEWERTASPGEVPSGWDQIVRQRGKRSDFPIEANSVCVSVVGLAFVDPDDVTVTGMIAINDDDPMCLDFYEDTEKLQAIIESCEVVKLSAFDTWMSSVEAWFASLHKSRIGLPIPGKPTCEDL